MPKLQNLFEQNRIWSERKRAEDPDFFQRLSQLQNPEYLWIGCSDSRVPANEIIGLLPGEVFVHRNIANQVVHSDLNCLSVIQFAVDVLHVKHILVVGHENCGGVRAALQDQRHGLVDNWLRHVKDTREKHKACLARAADSQGQIELLCELNVIEQVFNVCQTTVIRDAWERGQDISVHGWVYKLSDGLARDLDVSAGNPEEAQQAYKGALARLYGTT